MVALTVFACVAVAQEQHSVQLPRRQTTDSDVVLASGASVPTAGEWKSWPDARTPPAGCPFPLSNDITGWEYLEAANANYGAADTWYPSWGADGDLYTPWTDGQVDGVRSSSRGVPNDGTHGPSKPAFSSTTGQARVRGDNPFSLTLMEVKTFRSFTYPYLGRYPCGSLSFGNMWAYGTYYLDNPNTTVLLPNGTNVTDGPNPSPDCGNWCVMGPFVGFRFSSDGGQTWTEPRLNATLPTDNLFGETAFGGSKVNFGAPHVVDFGKNMENSPDGKVYIVGHGGGEADDVQGWMLGGSVNLARCDPTPEAMMNRESWEFWGGAAKGWVKGDVAQSVPIAQWRRQMGVVTVTRVPKLGKYIMTISTASKYPSMVAPFDTYFLESDAMTGPWALVSYLREFGPEAYFANHPSKFLAAEPSADGTFHSFLSYSANFAYDRHGGVPTGSGYHWSLQHARFNLSTALRERL